MCQEKRWVQIFHCTKALRSPRRPRCQEHLLRVFASLSPDGRTAQHARELSDLVIAGQRPNDRDGAAVRRLLVNAIVMIRERRDLWKMRDANDLACYGECLELSPDHLRDRAAYSNVDLVKQNCLNRGVRVDVDRFVELEGRFAAVARNLLNLKTLLAGMDPRIEGYTARLAHLALARELLQQSADRYRQKYEMSNLRVDDIKAGINFLGALRRLHVVLGESEQAEIVKKKAEIWKAKMEDDLRKAEQERKA